MKVLIVYSRNKGYISPFIKDQAKSLINKKIIIDYYSIVGKGLKGYLHNLKDLKTKIREFEPDLIHAHYGLCCLLANLQRKIPVVVTYHGSDINLSLPRFFSKVAIKLSTKNIFVSKNLSEIVKITDPIIIPCGINLNLFKPIDMTEARAKMGLDLSKIYVLFSSSFDNPVKNYSLAESAVNKLTDLKIELLELRGYSSDDVAYLLNAVNIAIMTSFSEGSPQFIKEAMACNTPIVSVDVGEVRNIIKQASNCYIVENYFADKIAICMRKIIESGKRSNGREYIQDYEESIIASKIIEIYTSLV